jgi:hypothetical protein
MDKLNLMTDEEVEEEEQTTRKNWLSANIKALEQALRTNFRIKQYTEIKIRVLRELINERQPDNKSKQYPD